MAERYIFRTRFVIASSSHFTFNQGIRLYAVHLHLFIIHLALAKCHSFQLVLAFFGSLSFVCAYFVFPIVFLKMRKPRVHGLTFYRLEWSCRYNNIGNHNLFSCEYANQIETLWPQFEINCFYYLGILKIQRKRLQFLCISRFKNWI